MNLLSPTDETWMGMALREAQKSYDLGEVPVGAVIVFENQIIARAHNQVEMLKDGTAHAEMLAITQAANAIGNWRLNGARLFVTKEPCAMCAGAMVNSRVEEVIFGCADPRSGCAGSALDVTRFPGMLHRVEVVSGVMHEDCLFILQRFFRERRDKTAP